MDANKRRWDADEFKEGINRRGAEVSEEEKRSGEEEENDRLLSWEGERNRVMSGATK